MYDAELVLDNYNRGALLVNTSRYRDYKAFIAELNTVEYAAVENLELIEINRDGMTIREHPEFDQRLREWLDRQDILQLIADSSYEATNTETELTLPQRFLKHRRRVNAGVRKLFADRDVSRLNVEVETHYPQPAKLYTLVTVYVDSGLPLYVGAELQPTGKSSYTSVPVNLDWKTRYAAYKLANELGYAAEEALARMQDEMFVGVASDDASIQLMFSALTRRLRAWHKTYNK